MFEELVISGTKRSRTHQWWTVWLSGLLQAAVLTVLILIPLIYTEALPKAMLTTLLVAPPPPPPPPPPAPKIVKIKPTPRLIQAGKMTAPTVIPKKIEIIKEEAMPPEMGTSGGVPGGVPGGVGGGVLGGIIGGMGSGPAPPPQTPKRIRIGGNVQMANLTRMVQPIYPPIAKTARIQGDVVLHAIISKAGAIEQLQYISGPPLLMQSAMEAVRQWRYRPTLLNGEPVEVETTITVHFTMGG
jgi:periplasmic protein TonB